jgi:triacylglycerol lipase
MIKTFLIAVKVLALTLFASTAFASGGGSSSNQCDANVKPIVFVHGYNGGNFNWIDIMNYLEADGHPRCSLYGFEYSSWFSSNAQSGRELSSFVEDVRSKHNNQKVTIISHSNGGLVTRWFRVMEGGSEVNDKFISLAAPHNGTSIAFACFNPSCFDMRAGSDFLNTLAGRGCDVSLWSAYDGVILPAASAICGNSTRMADENHLSMLWAPSVYQDIKNNL